MPKAVLFRMVLPDHTCPFGLRALKLLETHGYEVDDRVLRSRSEVDAFEAKEGVDTTPLIFVDAQRIGGSDALEEFLARG